MQVKYLFLNLGNQCNNDCIFCDRHREALFMRLRDIPQLDELIACSSVVDITGTGEVMIHPDFRELVDKCTKAKKPFRLTTNGTLLDANMLDYLKQSTLQELCVSLNSLRQETYKALTRRDVFPQVYANLCNALKKPRTFNIIVSFVMTTLNFDELMDIVRFAKRFDVAVRCADLTPTIKDYPEGLRVPDNDKTRKTIVQAWKLATQLSIRQFECFSFDCRYTEGRGQSKPLSERIKACRSPYELFAIHPSGNVLACCFCRVPMGNVHMQSAQEIWDGPVYNDLRACVSRGDTKYCTDCMGV